MKPEELALIVLASGQSKRFGAHNKMLVDFKGKPLISHIMGTVSDMNFLVKLAVIPNDEPLVALVSRDGFEPVINNDPAKGQGRSLAIGAQQAISKGCAGAIVVLGDMPFINGAHLETMLSRMEDNDGVMSNCDGVSMPPACFNRKALKRLSQNTMDVSGKTKLADLSIATLPLSTQQARDIDTKEDLAAAQKL